MSEGRFVGQERLDPEDSCEEAPKELSFTRRRQLAALAEKMAYEVIENARTPRERRLFRRMLDNLLDV